MCCNTLLENRILKIDAKEIFENLVKADDFTKLIELFSLNIIDINIRDCRGRNALYFAISNKKYEYIKYLFDLNISPKVSYHLNALCFAVCLDDTKALDTLLKCGLDIDTLDEIACSPLIYAILYNKKKSVDFLIRNNANIELEDFMGNCAKDLLKR